MDRTSRFLSGTVWANATRENLAQDASSRSYQRLTLSDHSTAILAIDPTPSSLKSFVEVGAHLLSIGLSAPKVHASDPEAGLLLLEDFGDNLFPAVITKDPAAEHRLYEGALDAIFVVTSQQPPQLAPLTPAEMAQQDLLAFEYYAGQGVRDAEAVLYDLFARHLSEPNALILRDVHAGNLIWLPDRYGPARIGFLDFQDARLAPPLYDVVSLIEDARRDVPRTIAESLYQQAAEGLGRSFASVETEAAVLSLQRNLRILGVFGRLCLRDSRKDYLKFLPRTWRHVQASLRRLNDRRLDSVIGANLPEPTNEFLSAMEKACGSRQTP